MELDSALKKRRKFYNMQPYGWTSKTLNETSLSQKDKYCMTDIKISISDPAPSHLLLRLSLRWVQLTGGASLLLSSPIYGMEALPWAWCHWEYWGSEKSQKDLRLLLPTSTKHSVPKVGLSLRNATLSLPPTSELWLRDFAQEEK